MSVAFPLLVLERDSGDVMRFDSVAEMQKQLERIDVENEEYLAWESGGRPIRMTVEEPLWLKLESKAAESDTAGLFSALQKFAESRMDARFTIAASDATRSLGWWINWSCC